MRMRGKLIASLFALVLLALVTSCASFVKTEPGAENIRLIGLEEAAACESIGHVDVQVLAKVGAIKRNPQRQTQEAATLARNSAKDFDANAIAARAPIDAAGKQVYNMYKC